VQQGDLLAAVHKTLARVPAPAAPARRLALDLAGALLDAEREAADLRATRALAAAAQASRAYRAAVRGRTAIENLIRWPKRARKRRRGEM
jgi:hypothetical protein